MCVLDRHVRILYEFMFFILPDVSHFRLVLLNLGLSGLLKAHEGPLGTRPISFSLYI
jgi:hypothetical protein